MGRGQRVVVVTGASSGIGRAVAVRLARRGDDVVLAARGEEALADVAAACRRRGARVLVVPPDVADEAAVRHLVAAAVDRFGRVDAWVGAAAVWSYGRFEDTPSTVFRQVVETTFLGQVHGARAVLPVMRAQGSGTVVLVSSLYGRLAAPLVAPYVAAKWALEGFARSLRLELRDVPGVDVVTVVPPTVDTPIYQHAANLTGRQVRPLPPAVSADRVARAVVVSTLRPRRQRVVGVVQRPAVWVQHLAPWVGDRLTPAVVEGLTVVGRRRVGPHDGTVFTPPSRPQPTSGGWRRRDRTRLALVGAAAAGAWRLARRRGRGSVVR